MRLDEILRHVAAREDARGIPQLRVRARGLTKFGVGSAPPEVDGEVASWRRVDVVVPAMASKIRQLSLGRGAVWSDLGQFAVLRSRRRAWQTKCDVPTVSSATGKRLAKVLLDSLENRGADARLEENGLRSHHALGMYRQSPGCRSASFHLREFHLWRQARTTSVSIVPCGAAKTQCREKERAGVRNLGIRKVAVRDGATRCGHVRWSMRSRDPETRSFATKEQYSQPPSRI
eukprot:6191768-Pleurochrysis_carterae.AAC.1